MSAARCVIFVAAVAVSAVLWAVSFWAWLTFAIVYLAVTAVLAVTL